MDVNNVGGVRADISEMLSKIREVSSKSKVFTEHPGATPTKNFDSILSMTKSALSNINQVQVDSEKLKNAYVSGDTSVSMSQVVLSGQKSKLAFEGLISVRNKILEAYKEIMNMPV